MFLIFLIFIIINLLSIKLITRLIITMSISQLIDKYRLPNYFVFWFAFNLIFVLIYSCLYMLYTDGQVTVNYLEMRFNFSNSSFLYDYNNPNNLQVISENSFQDAYSTQSFHRFYNQQLDKNHFIQKFNYYLFILIIPLFNIVYGLILIFDGSIIPPKTLYISIVNLIRGVKYE